MKITKVYILTLLFYANFFFIGLTFGGIGDGAGLFETQESATEAQSSGTDSYFESSGAFGNTSFTEEPMAVSDPPPPNPDEEPIPLDGGAIALLISGGMFGVRKLFNQKKA